MLLQSLRLRVQLLLSLLLAQSLLELPRLPLLLLLPQRPLHQLS